MRTFAYVRVESNIDINLSYNEYFCSMGYKIFKHRVVVEEVSINVPVRNRDKFINLITYSLEENDTLIVKSLDCLGMSFMEISSVFHLLQKNKIRLICIEFSKNEIKSDIKLTFLHFLKLSSNFEISSQKKNHNISKKNKKVGRPEILNQIQQSEVVEKFKGGQSMYSLAREYSVTRTVIHRLLHKNANLVY